VRRMELASPDKLPDEIALYQQRKKPTKSGGELGKRLPEGKLKDLIAVQGYDASEKYMEVVDRKSSRRSSEATGERPRRR